MGQEKNVEDGVEMSLLASFMLALFEAQGEDKEDEFFDDFVTFIRHGQSVKSAIHFSKNKLEDEG